jgi:O-ureido-D-serine cyclo-ligase
MPRIALITAHAARGTDYDMPLLRTALRDAGADADEVDWDAATIDWSPFDLALLRSTWDYCERLPEFLAWATRTAQQTRLLNPLHVIRWNTDKHYLAALARAGVPVVPSRFVEPGDDAEAAFAAVLSAHPAARDIVVKPAVGAGSRDAERHPSDRRGAAIRHIRRLLDAQRSVLLQPYLDRVDADGETALVFFEGAFSHAIRKEPLLQRGAEATRELYATEAITPRTPSADELNVAQRTLAAIPLQQPLLYARVDLIRADDGSPRLLELELVEPSVFVGYAAGAAARFAAAILQRATASPRR